MAIFKFAADRGDNDPTMQFSDNARFIFYYCGARVQEFLDGVFVKLIILHARLPHLLTIWYYLYWIAIAIKWAETNDKFLPIVLIIATCTRLIPAWLVSTHNWAYFTILSSVKVMALLWAGFPVLPVVVHFALLIWWSEIYYRGLLPVLDKNEDVCGVRRLRYTTDTIFRLYLIRGDYRMANLRRFGSQFNKQRQNMVVYVGDKTINIEIEPEEFKITFYDCENNSLVLDEMDEFGIPLEILENLG